MDGTPVALRFLRKVFIGFSGQPEGLAVSLS